MRIKPRPGVIWDYINAEDIHRDELARRVGVDRVTAYRIDWGKTDPSPKFIAGFISVTGKSFDELFEIVAEDAVA